MSDIPSPEEPQSRGPDAADRLRGILEQTKADTAVAVDRDVRRLLRERLDQAGVQVTPAEFDALAAEVEESLEA